MSERSCAALGETIFALSSGLPPAGVALVRLSGPAAGAALARLAGRRTEARRACVRMIRDPGSGERLDSALTLWFPGPASATGEDMAELHLHGGRAVVAAVLAVLAREPGLRAAAPGEFTRRAFLNGRIDLAEAEGLADLIEAETETQRRNALALAGGALGRSVAVWQARLLTLAAAVEARLDFADEADVSGETTGSLSAITALASEMRSLLARPAAERLREGVRVVIAGPPNAGKSTLLNALVGREAAIATPFAGTTRDLIEAPAAIAGIPFLLTDTAGLRASDDPVERIGVERARAAIDAADLILWLGAAHDAPASRAALLRLSPQCDRNDRAIDPGADLAISATTGEGVDTLVAWLLDRARALLPAEGEVAWNARQRSALGDCASALDQAAAETDELLIAEGLRAARAALDRITGRAGVEDMLDSLFGRFCIGK